MFKMYTIHVVVVFLINVPLRQLVELDPIDCGVDEELEVQKGDVELTQYPWLGVLYYTYFGDVGETRAVTTVALIQKEFVIAAAADIGPMPKHDFRRNSRVLLGQPWNREGRRVTNYVLHPEYGDTLNTIALVQLKDPVRDKQLKPLCAPPDILRDPIFYVIKFKTDYNELQKQVIPVSHVPADLCKEFYVKANLYSKKMRPPHVACAVALDEDAPCVWGAGAALAARDAWGRWQLLGIGVRGPGCGAPSRYLDMGSYYPWIRHSLSQFKQITISKLSKQSYVLRAGGGSDFQRFGVCDEEEKTNLIFRELIHLKTDTIMMKFLTYNLTIDASTEYTCMTLDLQNCSAVSEMRVIHYCPRHASKPCYHYKESRFDLSVYITFSHSCLFRMNTWGFRKNLAPLDTQEWKWEEGTYYEDFSMSPHRYKGQTYVTDFGYEPLDEKMWVPDYDSWTTTALIPTTPTLTEYPPIWYIYIPTIGTPETTTIPTTTSTTALSTRRYFKLRYNRTRYFPPPTVKGPYCCAQEPYCRIAVWNSDYCCKYWWSIGSGCVWYPVSYRDPKL